MKKARIYTKAVLCLSKKKKIHKVILESFLIALIIFGSSLKVEAKTGEFIGIAPSVLSLNNGISLLEDNLDVLSDNITGNTINIITGGTFNNSIYGGYSESADTTGNTVNIITTATATFNNSVYGGYSVKGNSTGNTVNIITTATAIFNNSVYGGYSKNGDATGNFVNITGGTFNNGIYGGYSKSSNAIGNFVNISAGNFNNSIYAGYSESGDSTANTINISGGTFNAGIYGGYSVNGDSTANTVNISTTITGGIYGGYSESGNATANTVNISTTTTGIISGGHSVSGSATANTVNINGGNFNTGSVIYGGSSTTGNATDNIVNINGGTFDKTVYGGYSTNGSATDNIVNINGGVFNTGSVVSGGHSVSGSATDNIVNINGGNFNNAIYGGSSTKGNVTGNTVNITGGTFGSGSVISGGYLETTGILPALHGNTVILNNTSSTELNLSDAILTGGRHGNDMSSTDIRRTGNRLVVKNKAKIGEVRNFEYYDFYINKHTDDALLTGSSGKAVNFGSNAHFFINIADTSEQIEIGDFIKLISNVTMGVGGATTNGEITGTTGASQAVQGMSLMHNLMDYYDTSSSTFGMRVTSSEANPQSATFTEARLASFSFINQGNDLLIGEGIASAMDATAITLFEWTFFGLISGVYSEYDAGVGDSTGLTTFGGPAFMFGVAKAIPIRTDNLLSSVLLGAYFETGIGFIDSEIDTIFGSVNTSGNANYYGLGGLIRYTIYNGFYSENFFRVGLLDNKMSTQNADYGVEHDFSSIYFGAGMNLGYEVDLFNSRDMLDIYTRYTWAHLVEGEGSIDGQNYKFNTINSHQVSIGLRYNFIEASMFSPHLGVRVKHEFAAKSVAKINEDYETVSRSLEGFTWLGEVGVRVTPKETLPLTMALNLGGHTGVIEGFDITFDIEYLFGSDRKQDKKEKEAKELEVSIANENVKVENIDEGIIVKIGEFLFEVESYELTEEGIESLQVIIDEIKRKYTDKKIIVRGHTDSVGDIRFNQYLSEQRAIGIIEMMKYNIESDRISYEGRADTEPIDTNSTSTGRAKNRRVEIIIILE